MNKYTFTSSVRTSLLKFYIRHMKVEFNRAQNQGLTYYRDSMLKEFGDELQQSRILNKKLRSGGGGQFFANTGKTKDYSLLFKVFAKERVQVIQGEVWVHHKTEDKIKIVGILDEYVLYKMHNSDSKPTNIINKMSAKEFRKEFQLHAFTLDSLWELL